MTRRWVRLTTWENGDYQQRIYPPGREAGRLPARSSSDTGQGLVEFALVLGLIVTFLLGMVDLTNVLQQRADLDKIARQAARQAGEFGGGKDQVKAYVDTQLVMLHYDPIMITGFEVQAQELQPKVGSSPPEDELVYIPGQEVCSYGDFITVKISMDWDVSVPTQLFFEGFARAGTLTMEHTSKCWRSE